VEGDGVMTLDKFMRIAQEGVRKGDKTNRARLKFFASHYESAGKYTFNQHGYSTFCTEYAKRVQGVKPPHYEITDSIYAGYVDMFVLLHYFHIKSPLDYDKLLLKQYTLLICSLFEAVVFENVRTASTDIYADFQWKPIREQLYTRVNKCLIEYSACKILQKHYVYRMVERIVLYTILHNENLDNQIQLQVDAIKTVFRCLVKRCEEISGGGAVRTAKDFLLIDFSAQLFALAHSMFLNLRTPISMGAQLNQYADYSTAAVSTITVLANASLSLSFSMPITIATMGYLAYNYTRPWSINKRCLLRALDALCEDFIVFEPHIPHRVEVLRGAPPEELKKTIEHHRCKLMNENRFPTVEEMRYLLLCYWVYTYQIKLKLENGLLRKVKKQKEEQQPSCAIYERHKLTVEESTVYLKIAGGTFAAFQIEDKNILNATRRANVGSRNTRDFYAEFLALKHLDSSRSQDECGWFKCSGADAFTLKPYEYSRLVLKFQCRGDIVRPPLADESTLISPMCPLYLYSPT
jgi:hypothetical protein